MSETLLWVIGSGGLLGSHLRRAISQHVRTLDSGNPCHLIFLDRSGKVGGGAEPRGRDIRSSRAREENSLGLLWCAGKGVMSSSAVVPEPEWSAWTLLLDLLGRYLAGPSGDVPGSIFLASSAGGVYGGSLGHLRTEYTPPRLMSAYGTHKLRMEQTFRSWVTSYSLIFRPSSVGYRACMARDRM